jgi:hypothetical protein
LASLGWKNYTKMVKPWWSPWVSKKAIGKKLEFRYQIFGKRQFTLTHCIVWERKLEALESHHKLHLITSLAIISSKPRVVKIVSSVSFNLC